MKPPISDAIQKFKSYRICLRLLRKSSTSNNLFFHYMGYGTTECREHNINDGVNLNKCDHMLGGLDNLSDLNDKVNT